MMRWFLFGAAFAAPCMVLALACGSHGSGEGPGNGGGDDGGSAPDGGPTVVGQLDGAPDTKLPPLPPLTNVTAVEREDSVGIDFDPVNGAVDYRVYPLPADGDVTINADGSVNVKNAIYRCAGTRQTFDLHNDLNANDPNLVVNNPPFDWKAQSLPNPTLGYVYVAPAPDRVPVYAVAGYPTPAEVGGVNPELGWRESRFKIYTTDASERQTLLAQNWRDDGIVFYVPATASGSTQTIYRSQNAKPSSNGGGNQYTQHQQYYFGEADKGAHAGDTTKPAPAFQVLKAADPNASPATQPLMGVFYVTDQQHTELAVGPERYARALNQGNGPLWHVEWAGITQSTILVVEALKSGCPFQGFLSPQSLNAPPHQQYFTLDELKAASPTGEVFINGEYDGVSASPIALARSFVQVGPQPHDPAAWDWYEGFNVGTDFGPVKPLPVPGTGGTTCDWHGCFGETPTLTFGAYELDQPTGQKPIFTYGQFLGQLWAAWDDTGQDVTSRVRFAAKPTATVAGDKYLHVTMTANIVSTQRRYPQIIVSDQPAPVDCFDTTCNGIGTATSNTLLIQTIQGPSLRLETQAIHGLVNGQAWNVNNQAPEHHLLDFDQLNMTVPGSNMGADPPFEHAGMDRMTTFDAFVSSSRLYVFVDGKPAGCTTYPADFVLNGTVSVTFGAVLYHETAETSTIDPRLMSFIHRHQFQDTSRQFDDLGFKSGVAASSDPLLGHWDEAKLPCGSY